MTITVKNKTPLVVPPAVQRRAGLDRRAIDARLAEARKGPYYGPFDTANEAVKFLRKEIRARRTGKRRPSETRKSSCPTVPLRH